MTRRAWSRVVGCALILGLLVAGGCGRDVPAPDLMDVPAINPESHHSAVQTTLIWLSVVGLLGFAVSLAAAVALRSKACLSIALGCVAVVAACWILDALLPYLLWVALGLVVVVAVVVYRSGWVQRKLADLQVEEAARFGAEMQRVARTHMPEKAAEIEEEARERQRQRLGHQAHAKLLHIARKVRPDSVREFGVPGGVPTHRNKSMEHG